MKILICIKQVPEIMDVKINPETGTLIREGVNSILNPFCEYAVEKALELKKIYNNAETIAISMGPPQARSALMHCLEMGIDRAILLADRAFAGADTWATALTLARAIKTLEQDYGLILVGKQAIDGDTAQVGPELSEVLGIPQVMYGVNLEPADNKKKIRVKREIESGNEIVDVKVPCLVSISKGPLIRSVSSFKDILWARKKELKVITSRDLNLDQNEIGLTGSFTQVVKIFPPKIKKKCELIEDIEPLDAADKIKSFLKDRKFI